jgi:hypothetical protein
MNMRVVCAAIAVALTAACGVQAAGAAALDEPLLTSKGEYVSLELMKSRYDNFKSKDRVLAWLDNAYKAMWDLTGQRPYDGGMIRLQETARYVPPAGGTYAINTAIVGRLIEDANHNVVPFELVAVVGRSFDSDLGAWTIWNEASADWQATWKLDYAYDTMAGQDFKARWRADARAGFNPPVADMVIPGRQLMDSAFLFYGDAYLGDPSRAWTTMTGGDLHSFFLRMKDQYGWGPFKEWYRAYQKFDELGLPKPEKPEEKINLIAAILCQTTGSDLVPAFKAWRMPVTAESVAEMRKRYPIARVAETAIPESLQPAPPAPLPDNPAAMSGEAKPSRSEAGPVRLTVESVQPHGIMKGGWGNIRFTFQNTGTEPVRVTRWTRDWFAHGEPLGRRRGRPDRERLTVGPKDKATITKLASLDPPAVDAAAPDSPVWAGTFTLQVGGKEIELPWRLEVPVAVITEKMVRVEGKYMAYEITERHHKMLGENNARLIRWLDHAYVAMRNMTGYVPYEGRKITIIESPPHPYYAYAGNPIIMDTSYMDQFVAQINRGEIPQGWIHELGHDFDICDYVHPDWYGLGLESQANIKVVYAIGTMPDKDFIVVWDVNRTSLFPAPRPGLSFGGREGMDKKFLFNRDDEMANPNLRWEDSFCEHVFLQRLARIYGWDVVRRYYRTAEIISKKGVPWVEDDPERIDRARMQAAILSAVTGVDLVPAYRRWRVPITQEEVRALQDKYGIMEAAGSVTLSGLEYN